MSASQIPSEPGRFELSVVRHKVRRIIGRAGFTFQDRPDLEQELLLRMWESLKFYDAARGCRRAFIVAVVERDISNLLREATAQKRDRSRISSLYEPTATTPPRAPIDDLDTGANDRHRQQCPRPPEELDWLRQDVAELLRTLTVPERILAVRLMTQSISDIAWETGVPRTTVQEHVNRLRRKLWDTGLATYLQA